MFMESILTPMGRPAGPARVPAKLFEPNLRYDDSSGATDVTNLEDPRTVLRDVQLRLCLPLYHRANDGPPYKRCLYVFNGIPDRKRASYGSVSLDNLGFIVLGFTPEEMGKGNWSVGLIADSNASAQQQEAITAIATGGAGGPMSVLSGLIGKFLGVESSPIVFDRAGASWSVKASTLVDMAANAAMGVNPNASEPLHLDNTGHPANDRFALAHASKSHVHAFGLSWNDTSGRNNGQFAPFSWQSA